ncbi:peptidoglycan DD-metalloendopeptidase family protein [Candidatus Peregrinibacteria bacterium]|nr:peptidoglycan DD-metalloendopeptidase family protein [Candidatus Peregrinibacteria bacterium]
MNVLLILISVLSSYGEVSNENYIPSAEESLGIAEIYYPIENFESGITAKPFGIYISPEASPIQPERFTGFHTGVDVEVPQDAEDVWVYAIDDGEVITLENVNGYGGVIQLYYPEEDYTALYGHLDIKSSLVSVGDEILTGDRLALLGDAYSFETDGERKHLHFSLKPGLDRDFRGYVQTEEELDDWVDPEQFINTF